MQRFFLVLLVLISALFVPVGARSQPVDSPTDPPSAATLDGAQIGERIDRYLSAMEALGFSGSIVVSHQGEIVLRNGYGMADRKTRRPYTPTTVQSHGSITKQMTAACILLLESRGELSVEDSVTRYFDDVPPDKQGITLHQLLTHSSGLPGGIGPDEEPIAAEVYVERVMAEPLGFDPGTSYAYSNVGYALLGMVVEGVSGKGYESFLREELLLPGGLTDTGYVLPGWDQDRLALGYRKGELWGVVHERGWLEDGPGWHLRANGGLHTTVDDMLRWLDTLRGRGALDAATVERWTTGYVDEGGGYSFYAYGWVTRDTEWGPMIAHSGSNQIFSADFVWLPQRELFLYIQGNTSMAPARGQRDRLLAAAFDPEFPMPPLVEADENARPEVAAERVGTYRLGEGSLEVTADDTRLLAKLWGQSTLDLLLQPTEEQRAWFAVLNRRTRGAMDALEAGQEDALAGIMRENEDVTAETGELLARIEQIGGLQELHVIGTFKNVPGSRFEDFGPWTTFVYAQFENWNQYWNLIWNEDGTYQGNARGPWPSFTLVPTAEGRYRAVQQGVPWHAVDLRFEESCLVSAGLRACPEE
jgi:CubicO group peptidase (beta-lactamase class C family)